MYGGFDPDEGIKVKWAKKGPAADYLYSVSLDVVTAEDLLPGDPSGYEFNTDRQEWAFSVIGSSGFPRKYLGIMVLKARGTLIYTTVE